MLIHKDFTVYEADNSVLWELAQFVVKENISHHTSKDSDIKGKIQELVYKVYKEETELADRSKIFIVRNNTGDMVGSIRSTLWDRKAKLPMETLFGFNPLDCDFSKDITKYWHIGRLAINKEASQYPKSILKTLINIVTAPIKKDPYGCLLAEVDRKLFNNLKALGIDAHQIAPSKQYLASETIPIYSMSSDILISYKSS